MTDRASRLEIRPATPADRAFLETGVGSTFDAHARLNPGYFTPRRRAGFLANVDSGLTGRKAYSYRVATVDGARVGYVSILGTGSLRIVQDIFVAPDRRGRGVARALLDDAAQRAGRDNARFLHATVWDGNDASHALFASLGYAKKDGLLPSSIASLFPSLRATEYLLRLR